jgi:hypothetical protein
MGKAEALRKLIREEVVKALRQELPRLIAEAQTEQPKAKKPVYEQTFIPKSKPAIQKPAKTGNVIQDLLNETAQDMMSSGEEWPTMQYNTQNMGAMAGPQMMPIAQQGPVMMDGADFSPVNSSVPDFNGLMDKMLSNGTIK